MPLPIRSAITASAGDSFTGSIAKIQALGTVSASLSHLVYGLPSEPAAIGTLNNLSEGGSISFQTGDSIEGPILRFKVAAGSNDVLIYLY
jgi:hypothetical protein